jgi:hypothetical protein
VVLGIDGGVWISAAIVAVGLVGAAGLVVAGRLGVGGDGPGADGSRAEDSGAAGRGTAGAGAAGSARPGGLGRVALLSGLAGAGMIVGLVGAMLQGYSLRVGGSGQRLLDAGDPASGTGGSAGFALPLGAVLGLVLLTGLLLVAGTTLRQPRAVGAAAGGWLAVVGLLMFGAGTGGDVVLANDSAAQIFVYGGLVVAFGIGVLVYQWQLTDKIVRAAAHRPADRVR